MHCAQRQEIVFLAFLYIFEFNLTGSYGRAGNYQTH